MKVFSKKRHGFTLIEMTIVLFIISLLILIIIPNISKVRDRANTVHKDAMVSVIKTQVDDYFENNPKLNTNDQISLDTLKSGGYLTQDQYDKANNEGISIGANNQVEADKSK